MNEETQMTDYQFKYFIRLHKFIRKLLKLVPQDSRDELENEFDEILQSEIES